MTYLDIYAFDCGTTNWRVYRLTCQEEAGGPRSLSDPQRVGLTTFTDSHLPAALVLDEREHVLAYGENAYELAGDAALRPRLRDAFKLCIGNRQPLDPQDPRRRYTHAEALNTTRLLLEQVTARLAEERPGSLDGDALFFFAHPVHWGRELADGRLEGEILPDFATVVRGCFPEPVRGNIHFVPEPSAALLSLGQSGQLPSAGDTERLTLLIDVGGGTTDFVAGRWTGAGFEGVRTYGEALGGGVFDAALADYVADALQVPADRRPEAWAELRHFGRQLKERLSQQMRMEAAQAVSMTVTLKLDGPDGAPAFLSRKLHFGRQEFEAATAQQTAAFEQMAARALASMDLAAADVARVVLVGGGANLYLMPQWIASLVGSATPVIYGDPPEDVVARGAALWTVRPKTPVDSSPTNREKEEQEKMDQSTPLSERAVRAREDTIALIDALHAQATTLKLPKPPEALQRGRDKLVENAYTVLVVGEAKRGKSSFINALIGRDLLPTDVDIATSQVFRVRPAQETAYRIRFEDGSARAINAADLPRYGSQVMADVQGVPRLDQLIRWIEVDIPIKFLPPGVTLLDTPGMGSLYAAHAQVTQRFVPYADAVIYVLDSSQPLGQPDLEFIEQLLGVTSNLFFIQTNIDLYRKEGWQAIQQRNQALLEEHFADRLPSTRVWPISSSNLLKAAQTGDADYLAVSRHGELSAALQAFLFRVSGWQRAALAAAVAGRYFNQSRQTLAGRLAPLLEASNDRRAAWHEQAKLRQEQFEAEWGVHGTKRRDVLDRIQAIAQDGRRSFWNALEPEGAVVKTIIAQIDALKTMKEAKAFNDSLNEKITAEAVKFWQEVCTSTQTHVSERLESFLAEAEQVTAPTEKIAPDLGGETPTRISDDWFHKLIRASGRANKAYKLGYAIFMIPALTNPIALGIVALAWAGTTIWSLFSGWRAGEQDNLVKAQGKMRTHTVETVKKMQPYYFAADLKTGQRSLVDQYFDGLCQAVGEQVDTLAAQKLAEAKAETDRLTAQAQLDGQARQAEVSRVQNDLAAWDRVGATLAGLTSKLEALDEATALPA